MVNEFRAYGRRYYPGVLLIITPLLADKLNPFLSGGDHRAGIHLQLRLSNRFCVERPPQHFMADAVRLFLSGLVGMTGMINLGAVAAR